MNKDNVIEELAAMQKELREMKKYLGEAYVRYNNLNTGVNRLKRKLAAKRVEINVDRLIIEARQNPIDYEQESPGKA